tara:strand:- start:17365 stop:17784 length:420 start_codon:yes stop_codon:yes gene_type:complete
MNKENKEENAKEEVGKKAAETSERFAIVRVRGVTGIKYDIDGTLEKLNLHKKNYCVVVPKNASYVGMIKKVKDYVTWGDIDEKTYGALADKRKAGSKKVFRLNSPRKGYGRKGIKASFQNGGALDYRGDKINDLIMRMI